VKGIINPYIKSEKDFDEYTQWLQSKGNVWKVADKVYMATSYQEVKEALSDETVFAPNDIEKKLEKIIQSTQDDRLVSTQQFLKNWLAWLRGEEHSRWKKNLLLNFHSMNDLDEIVKQTTEQSIQDFFMGASGEKDLVSELIDPFVGNVILKTLNYDESTKLDIRFWSLKIRQILDPVWNAETVKNTNEGLNGLTQELIEKKNSSNFLDKTVEQLGITDLNFLYGNLQFYILAGVETSIYFLARAILVLVETGLYKTINWDNPKEVKVIAEELLRYVSPAVFVQRETTRSVTLGGQEMPEGSMVLLNICAANRDPSVFDDPYQLNFNRSNNSHIAFGYKKHVCFGKALSLLEIVNFLPRFFGELQKYQKVEIISTEYEKITLLRGLKSLRVKLCP
jgi:cytochrome P450